MTVTWGIFSPWLSRWVADHIALRIFTCTCDGWASQAIHPNVSGEMKWGLITNIEWDLMLASKNQGSLYMDHGCKWRKFWRHKWGRQTHICLGNSRNCGKIISGHSVWSQLPGQWKTLQQQLAQWAVHAAVGSQNWTATAYLMPVPVRLHYIAKNKFAFTTMK